jgi:hypothetical protein
VFERYRKSDKPKNNRSSETSTIHDFKRQNLDRQSSARIFTQLETIDEASMSLSVISKSYQIQFQKKKVPWKTKKLNLSTEDQIAVK